MSHIYDIPLPIHSDVTSDKRYLLGVGARKEGGELEGFLAGCFGFLPSLSRDSREPSAHGGTSLFATLPADGPSSSLATG